jgi:transposase
LRRRGINDSVCLIGRTEDHDGASAIRQAALFYEFSLEKHIPADHLLRLIDKFVDLQEIRRDLAPFYSSIGRPSIDPELMIRMLLIGYCLGIRSERRLCDEVHLDLAYRWFCRLGLDGAVPDHSTFTKNRHGRFRQSDLFRRVFESVLRRLNPVIRDARPEPHDRQEARGNAIKQEDKCQPTQQISPDLYWPDCSIAVRKCG